LAEQARRGRIHPVLFGAALEGVGVAHVIEALTTYLPLSDGDADKPLHASVFKIERGPAGHRVAFARLHDGTLGARDHLVVHRREPNVGAIREHEARAVDVTAFDLGAETVGRPARAGEIAKVLGIGDVAIGDQLGRWDPSRSGRHFPSPGLEAVVKAASPGDQSSLFQALQQLSEQDPLIDARLDGVDHEITVSVYGEVQKEVILARLEHEYGVVADFLPTRTVHIERPAGIGEAHNATPMGNASIGLRVEPGTPGSGAEYVMGVERGYLLPSFHVAIEETIPTALSEGLFGWRVTDCIVTLIHGRFNAPTPSAGEYRRLTATALREALQRAGTIVCAPFSRFELELPVEALTAVMARLVAVGARPEPPAMGTSHCRLAGTMPTEAVDHFEQRLPGLTAGQGVVFSEPSGYEPVHGPPPARTDSRQVGGRV
jgi:ribosomal protection tetracycline resistance protein